MVTNAKGLQISRDSRRIAPRRHCEKFLLNIVNVGAGLLGQQRVGWGKLSADPLPGQNAQERICLYRRLFKREA